MRMLDARGDIGGLVHDVGFGKALLDIADMAVDLGHDIAPRVVDAGFRPLVVEDRRAGLHRGFWIEYGRKQVVIDLELAATGFGGCLAFGNHRSDALADEADDVIQNGGVIGIAAFILVSRARIEFSRRVFPGQNGAHARHRQCGVFADRFDARMGMRRPQQLKMQETGRRDIERILRAAADNGRTGGCRHAAAASAAGLGLLDLAHAANGILDRAIAGATANIAFQSPGEILPLRLIQTRRRHDHARRTEAALIPLRLQEGLLHRMRLAIRGQAFDRRDRTVFGAIGGKNAAMHRLAIDQHRAGATIARVTSFLHAEPSELAQKRPQTLSGTRLGGVAFSVHRKGHSSPSPASSWQISSANCSVMCRRHAGAP